MPSQEEGEALAAKVAELDSRVAGLEQQLREIRALLENPPVVVDQQPPRRPGGGL